MPDPQRHDTAVAFCCDTAFFPLALFVIRQIAFHHPQRGFDIIISTRDELAMPDWAKPFGIILHRTGPLPEAADGLVEKRQRIPLDRMLLAGELGDRYRRILYLDSDIFFEAGDLGRLLEVDLGPHPLGAVLDAPFLYEATHHAREFHMLGLPPAPYANCGVQVIDTRAYREQAVAERAFEVCRMHPKAIVYSDQSITNLALLGKFAQLAPCWNWQNISRLPLLDHAYPVFIRHFIGARKPDRYAGRNMPVRYNQIYRDFLAQCAPELLSKTPAPVDVQPLTLRELGKLMLEHLLARRVTAQALARFPDPYKALL